MTALLYLGQSLAVHGQFEKALPILERSLFVGRECLPGDNLELTEGETVCIILKRLHDN